MIGPGDVVEVLYSANVAAGTVITVETMIDDEWFVGVWFDDEDRVNRWAFAVKNVAPKGRTLQ